MTEFIHIDAEMGFVNFDELLTSVGGLLKSVTSSVWETNEADLKKWNANPVILPESIPRLGLEEVHDLYSKATGNNYSRRKRLTPRRRKMILENEYAKKNLQSEAVFVTEWPVSEMKFYHRISAENPQYAERADLIFRVC